MTRTSLTCAALATAAVAANSAHAYSQTDSALRNTSIALVDLSGGALTPSFAISGIQVVSDTLVVGAGADSFSASQRRSRDTLDPLSAVAAIPLALPAGASTSFTGGAFGALTESAYAALPGNYRSTASFGYSFVLSPMAQLTFAGTLTARAESIGNAPIDQFAQSSAGVIFNNIFASSAAYSTTASVTPNSTFTVDMTSLDFSYTYTNLTAMTQTGQITVTVSGVGANISPVPELPSAWLLLTGVAGLAARRLAAPGQSGRHDPVKPAWA